MERSSPSAAQWSDLPGELLSVVRSKVMSPRGRVRFAAVCKSWRAAASLHPAPPAVPLLLPLSSRYRATLYCPEDVSLLRVPLPVPVRLNSMWFAGSYHGGWIAASPTLMEITRPEDVIPGPIMIMNLFTGAEVTLSEKLKRLPCRRYPGIRKIIFSEAPTSSGCILAAMTTNCKIALCRLGCPDGGWTEEGCKMEALADILFCGGELYGIASDNESLFKFDVGVNDDGAPVVTGAHQLPIQKRRQGPRSEGLFEDPAYIFELRGKIAMAMITVLSQNRIKRCFFTVYELVEDASNGDSKHIYKWSKVHALGAYALFLAPGCSSKAMYVPAGGRGGVERNHIYYSNHCPSPAEVDLDFNRKSYLTGSFIHGDKVYFSKVQSVFGGGTDTNRITSVVYYVPDSRDVPRWCFPPDL